MKKRSRKRRRLKVGKERKPMNPIKQDMQARLAFDRIIREMHQLRNNGDPRGEQLYQALVKMAQACERRRYNFTPDFGATLAVYGHIQDMMRPALQ